MTELSNESIKNLNKNELKIELTNRGLGTQGTKEVLLNRLSKVIQDMDTSESIELVKNIYKYV